MAIITISRGTFAGGQQLAALLASELGYQDVSRERLYEKVRQQDGFTVEEVIEVMDRAPSRFDQAGERRRRLLIAVQAALCELVVQGQVVYHGQMGHLLLPDISHVLRVRLIAPRARRIEMATQMEQINRFEAGRKIDRVDAERARWTQFVFGINWADPALYDLVLNLESMSVQEAALIVVHAASRPSFQATADSQAMMADLTLAARIRALLITEPATAELALKVEVEDGHVKLTGLANARDLEKVTSLVRGTEGVRHLQTVPTGGRRSPTGGFDAV